MLKEAVTDDKYDSDEIYLDPVAANTLSLLTTAPVAVIFGICVLFIESNKDISLMALLYYVIIIILHEATHGAVLGHFCENKYKSVKYGFNVKYLCPYCHCKEPLQIRKFQIGMIMPLFTAGILPGVIAVIIGDFNLLLASIIGILGAGGDVTLLALIKNEEKNVLALDSETSVGFTLFREKGAAPRQIPKYMRIFLDKKSKK